MTEYFRTKYFRDEEEDTDHIYQPNPGWATLCESCLHRDRTRLEIDSFPCRLAKFRGPLYQILVRRFIDGIETCWEFEKCQQEEVSKKK